MNFRHLRSLLPGSHISALFIVVGFTAMVAPGAELPVLRPAPVPTHMPAVPVDPGGYLTFAPTLGGIPFDHPVAVVSPPGETNRLFVVERTGLIKVVPDLAAPRADVFLDLREKVVVDYLEQGLLGMVFHPNYASNGWFYLYYVGVTNTTAGSGWHDILARCSVSPADPNQADGESLLPLIAQYDFHPSHQGGALAFGPDGFLYLGIGDGGDVWLGNNQRIDGNFFGGIFRLDVDDRPGSLPPNPHPASVGPYRVPADNPFIGRVEFNGQPVSPGAIRTEFYAMGLRNPWTFAFDPDSGDLICGDVGNLEREELDRVEKGGNYGYPYREGTRTGPVTNAPPAGFVAVEPLLDYERDFTPGPFKGHCIIYGFQYRGTRFPGLVGKHIFGDYGSFNVWSADLDENGVSNWARLNSQGLYVSRFGEDPGNGDVLMCRDLANPSPLLRLVLNTNASPEGTIPRTLSGTGLFLDVGSLAPAPGVIPYAVAVPLWSDGALKQRWFRAPSADASFRLNAEGLFEFPAGTMWVKHFDLPSEDGNTAALVRVETRILVKTSNSLYGVTYQYAGERDEALLVPPEGLVADIDLSASGTAQSQSWAFPSRDQCLFCHNSAAGYAAGFQPEQLNLRVPQSGGGEANQLDWLRDHGFVSNPGEPSFRRDRLAGLGEEAITLEHRARSLLHANCANCHRPGGPTPALWDLRISTPLEASGIVLAPVSHPRAAPGMKILVPGSPDSSFLLTRMTTPELRMPPLGTSLVDTNGVALVRRWIAEMAAVRDYGQWAAQIWGSADHPDAAPDLDPDGDQATNQEERAAGSDPRTAQPTRRLRWEPSPPGGGCPRLTWTRPAGARTWVETTDSLEPPGAWHPAALPGNDPAPPVDDREASAQPGGAAGPAFYRLRTAPR